MLGLSKSPALARGCWNLTERWTGVIGRSEPFEAGQMGSRESGPWHCSKAWGEVRERKKHFPAQGECCGAG